MRKDYLRPWQAVILGSVAGLIGVIIVVVAMHALSLKEKLQPIPTPLPRNIPLQIRGAIPYWDKTAVTSFTDNVKLFSHISLFWYYLTPEGDVAKYKYAVEDKELLNFAREHGVKTSMVITNLPDGEASSWNTDLVKNVINDPVRRQKHIDAIKNKIVEMGFDGVTIDYESLAGDLKNNFSKFISDLSASLHQAHKLVGVSLHAKSGSRGDRDYSFQDWPKLAKAADQLFIMAYDEHWASSSPGAVASYSWDERVVSYALNHDIPPQKLFLGIPFYGYDWNVDSHDPAKGLTYKEVMELIKKYDVQPQFDETSREPHFTYEADGDSHEVWYEDAHSVAEKIKLADDVGLSGVSFWRLGGEDPQVWERLKEINQINSSPIEQ